MKFCLSSRTAARRALLPLALGMAWGAAAAQAPGAAAAAEAAEAAAAVRPADPAPAPWRLSARSDRHSDVLTLSEVNREDYERSRSRSRRNLLYLEDELRLERAAGSWHVALLARSSATLVLNRDAVEVVAQASGAPAAGSRQWQTSARMRGFAGAGLELGQTLPLAASWRVGWSAQALALGRLQDRRIHGPVAYDAATDAFSFDLRSVEANDHRRFPFQQPFDAHGAGLLFGAELAWRQGDFGAALALRDAGWLRWGGLPQQDATLATNVTSRDADGYLLYEPLVQGQNRQNDYRTYWPARWALRGSWQAQPALELSASLQTVPGFGVLPAVAVRQRWAGGLHTTLGWRFHERRASAGLDWKGWRLEAGTDRLGGGAHSRLLALSWATAL